MKNSVNWNTCAVFATLLITVQDNVIIGGESIEPFKVYFRYQCVRNSTAILSLVSG